MMDVVSEDLRSELGEGAWWSVRDQAFYWVDILGQRLHRLGIADGGVSSRDLPEMIGWIIERRDRPGFLAGLASGVFELAFDPFAIRPFARLGPADPAMRLNDACADTEGAIWAGTMAVRADAPVGCLYRLDPSGAATCVDTGYTVPNGPAIVAAGDCLFHTDSPKGLIYRLELDEQRMVRHRSVHIRFEPDMGKPDGMTLDAEGCLWVCHWDGGRVSRHDPDGRFMRSLQVPASRVTNCAFGGPGLDRLYITTAAKDRPGEPLAGALFCADPGVRGLPACTFAG